MAKRYGNIVYPEEVSQLVQCIKDDIQPSLSGEDALEDVETITQTDKNRIFKRDSTTKSTM